MMSSSIFMRPVRAFCMVLAVFALGACESDFSDKSETAYPDSSSRNRLGGKTAYSEDNDTIFGPGGIINFGGEDPAPPQGSGGGGIGVNSYLWRASLDTISFMPLATADPFGGVIITDWYAPPEANSERFKVNVFILGRDLRADGVRAAVFRQQQSSAGSWIDVEVDAKTASDLENAILTRARQLRIAALQ
ncbi:MAG: DUF3576 domain-containing protein [Pseudomonadota bacterium]